METLIIELVVVIIFFIIVYNVTKNNKHSGFSLKILGFSFDKKESPPLIHNTETSVGSNFDDSSVFVESGRQAFKNEAPISASRLNVQEGDNQNSFNPNIIIRGVGDVKPYIQIDSTANVDINYSRLEVSRLVNKSGSTRINNTIISNLKDKKD